MPDIKTAFRINKKAIVQTDLKETFTEHDICAKTASDAEDVETVAKLRGHLNAATTEKTYRRLPNQVIPLKQK